MAITQWIWLTDPKFFGTAGFPPNYPQESPKSRRQMMLLVARIMKQMDGVIFEGIDAVNRNLRPLIDDADEFDHRTPIQSWAASDKTNNHLFAWSNTPVDTERSSFNPNHIDLVFGACRSSDSVKSVPLLGVNLRCDSLREIYNRLTADGWRDVLRKQIVEHFNKTAVPQQIPTNPVTDVEFIYRKKNPVATFLFRALYTDDKITVKSKVPMDPLTKVIADLQHS